MHLTTSAIAAIDVLTAAGIRPSNILLIAKNYEYAHGQFVGNVLRGRGVRIVPDDQLSDALFDEVATRVEGERLRLLTIEDGAEIVTRIHANPRLLRFWIGGAEQTTRGLWRLKELDIQQPVVALPTSKIKADFEGPHIAASGVHALRNFFPSICVADWRIALVGLGTIGRHLLIALDELGCDVAGFDQDPIQRLRCRHLRAKAVKTAAIDAIRGADLIIGTAGRLTIDADIIAAASLHIRIGSLSSERVETDVEHLYRSALRHEPLLRYPAGFPDNRTIGTRFTLPNRRTVDLLCGGAPINFSDMGVLCEKHTDVIVGWLICCGLDLCEGAFPGLKGILTDAADLVFQNHDLARQYERFWA
jgi:S-adenosylhomocysteine hydrolase